MAPKDRRHKEIINKIRNIMKDVGDDILVEGIMPSLEIPKVGYDNTVWSDDKRMLTIGNKTVQIGPNSSKKIPTFAQYLVMKKINKNFGTVRMIPMTQ